MVEEITALLTQCIVGAFPSSGATAKFSNGAASIATGILIIPPSVDVKRYHRPSLGRKFTK